MLKDKFYFRLKSVDDSKVYLAEKTNEGYLVKWGDSKVEYPIESVKYAMKNKIWEEIDVVPNKNSNGIEYVVYYKSPQDKVNTDSYGKFKGKLDNLNPTGLCAFVNNEGVMLHVRYIDIIQMRPLNK